MAVDAKVRSDPVLPPGLDSKNGHVKAKLASKCAIIKVIPFLGMGSQRLS